MLVVQWEAIYHPPRHTSPFVTIPKFPSSSSSSISIQLGKLSFTTTTASEGCLGLPIFVKGNILPPKILVISAQSNILQRESIYMACGSVWTWGMMVVGEFWVNVVTARKAGVAIVHTAQKWALLCTIVNCTLFCKRDCKCACAQCNCIAHLLPVKGLYMSVSSSIYLLVGFHSCYIVIQWLQLSKGG